MNNVLADQQFKDKPSKKKDITNAHARVYDDVFFVTAALLRVQVSSNSLSSLPMRLTSKEKVRSEGSSSAQNQEFYF